MAFTCPLTRVGWVVNDFWADLIISKRAFRSRTAQYFIEGLKLIKVLSGLGKTKASASSAYRLLST